MFAVYRFTPTEPNERQAESIGRDEFIKYQAVRKSRTAEELLRLYATTRPEYSKSDRMESATNPDSSYNYFPESLTLRAYVAKQDFVFFGVEVKKDEIVVVVNLDYFPDNHYLDELSYLFNQEPTIVQNKLDWENPISVEKRCCDGLSRKRPGRSP